MKGFPRKILRELLSTRGAFVDQEPNSLRIAKDVLGLFLTSGAWDTQMFLKIVGEIQSYSLICLMTRHTHTPSSACP